MLRTAPGPGRFQKLFGHIDRIFPKFIETSLWLGVEREAGVGLEVPQTLLGTADGVIE